VKGKKDILKRVPEPYCSHSHMKFDHMGNTLKCIDCKRTWKPIDSTGGIDMLYYDIRNASATRHSPFEIPRFSKIR